MKVSKVILVVVFIAALSLFVASPALASISLNKYEKQLVKTVNKVRAKRGLAKLRVNAKLVRASRAHSTEMGEQQYLGHDSSDGETWTSRIIRFGYKRSGYRYWKAGENLFVGTGLYSSPYYVVKRWMKSKAHRRVILTKAFRNIGVGAVKTEDGYKDWTGTVWFFTMDLGRRVAQ